jgi:4-hydroxybenzoate polyprenyltransferase
MIRSLSFSRAQQKRAIVRADKSLHGLDRTHSPSGPSLRAHLQIARLDHWIKNIFVVPGIVTALGINQVPITFSLLTHILAGLVSVSLVTSSNYVINEVADAPYDHQHPAKRGRPVPSGRVNIPLAYVQWLALMIVGIALGGMVSMPLMITALCLWGMGCIYNLPPLRSKDVPYLDVLSEAVNNPLRMLAGWFMVDPATIVPASLLLSYWMIGCYLMAIKRFAEYRDFSNATQAAAYRKSFSFYNEQRLLVSIMFYSSAAMLFFGAFIIRYRLELILSFPGVASLMALYLALSFKPDSAVQRPEKLYHEPLLVAMVIACALLMTILLFVDLPSLQSLFAPTAPTRGGAALRPFHGMP